MDAEFWHHKWENNDIAFHEKNVNPLLEAYFEQLHLAQDSRIFIPLCGKTRDIAWLINKGYRIVGAELSELAISQLFSELGQTPVVTQLHDLIHYQGQQIDIFVGDILTLSADIIGHIDAIYDRAALVALPFNIRLNYAPHLINITQHAPQLLICFEYDQQSLSPPPFSVSQQEVKQHYATHYQISLLHNQPLVGGLKGKVPANEVVWLLT